MKRIRLLGLCLAGGFAVIPAAALAAETDPHYYMADGKNAIIPEGERVPVVAFGTLTIKNVATGASATCHNVAGGWVENPKGTEPEVGHKGPAGIGSTQSFDPYECRSVPCTAESTLYDPYGYLSAFAEPTPFTLEPPGGTASNLDWNSVLKVDSTAKRAATTIRTVMPYVKIDLHCHVQTGTTETGEPVYGVVTHEISEGSNQPWTGPPHKGISPNYGFVEFDNPSEENGEGSGELHGPAGEETRKVKTEGRLQVVPYLKPGIINVKVG